MAGTAVFCHSEKEFETFMLLTQKGIYLKSIFVWSARCALKNRKFILGHESDIFAMNLIFSWWGLRYTQTK